MVGTALPRTDFGVPRMVLVLLALLISGGRRLRHLRYLDGDPMVLRLCGLTRLPTPRTVGRWLRAVRARHLPRLVGDSREAQKFEHGLEGGTGCARG